MSSSVFPAVNPAAAGAVAAERIADIAVEASDLHQLGQQALEALQRGDHELALQHLEAARKPAGVIAARVAWAVTAVGDAKAVTGAG